MSKITESKKGKLGLSLGIIALVVLYTVLSEHSIIFARNKYVFLLICMICIYSIVTSGVDLLFGYTGQISFGHAGFFCIGAYGTALLTHEKFGIAQLGMKPLPPVLSVIVVGLFAALVGALLAFPASKLVFHFLSLLTIAFNQIMVILIMTFSGVTQGTSGITRIPPIKIGPLDFTAIKSKYMYVFLVLTVLVLMLILKQNIVHSRLGRSMISIRENPTAANGCGVDVKKVKIISFAISAFYVGIAGALYAHMNAFIGMDSIQQSQSVVFITMLLFGGSGNLVGPILGAAIITLVQEGFQALQDYRMLIYGIFLLIVILFQPKGVIGLGHTIGGLFSGKGGVKNGTSGS